MIKVSLGRQSETQNIIKGKKVAERLRGAPWECRWAQLQGEPLSEWHGRRFSKASLSFSSRRPPCGKGEIEAESRFGHVAGLSTLPTSHPLDSGESLMSGHMAFGDRRSWASQQRHLHVPGLWTGPFVRRDKSHGGWERRVFKGGNVGAVWRPPP